MKLLLKIFTLLFLLLFFYFSLIGITLFIYFKLSLPSINKLINYNPIQTNLILDSQGNLIGFLGKKKRIFVPLEKIPPHVINAFIAAEDANFWHHKGIDFWGILRALIKDILARKFVQGGSTITQQVVKSVLLTPKKTITRKLKELFLAWEIEKYLTKKQILTIYLNHIYLGEGAYGVEAASLTYFSKHVWELNLNEAAVIAGLPPAPSKLNPIKNMKLAIKRRNYVLRRMAELGYITPEKALQIMKQPIPLKPFKISIPYYAAYFVDAMERELFRLIPPKKFNRGGYVIQTTLNKKWLKKAYPKVISLLKKEFKHQKLPQLAVVCLDNKNGAVRFLIGGRSFKESPYNRAILAKRQLGSAFKPFVWAEALEKGVITPFSKIPDEPIIIRKINNGKDWTPVNYDKKYLGEISVKDALAYSRNTVAVRLGLMLGLENLRDIFTRLDLPLPRVVNYALVLGTYEISPLNTARSYTLFPNLGIIKYPYFIEKIWKGIYVKRILIYNATLRERRAFSRKTAGIMNDFLQAVVNYGTGKCARALGVPAGGKTGTTQDYRDAWFIGYTYDYTCAVWVGHDNNHSLGWGRTGGRVACPLWLKVMQEVKQSGKPLPVYNYTRSLNITQILKVLGSEQENQTQSGLNNKTFKPGALPENFTKKGETKIRDEKSEQKTIFQKIFEMIFHH